MREVLFRGKRLCNGEWLQGGIVERDDRAYIVGVSKSLRIDGVEVDPETVCQFTGLTDKNGVMIYENDLLSINQSAEPVIVKFEDFQWKYKNRNFGKYYFHRLENIRSKYEAIGNIFDNPELLKGDAE